MIEEGLGRFERLFHEAPCALFTLDQHGRILEANRTLGDWVGATDLVGVRLADVLVPSSRILYDTRVLPVLAVGGRVDEVVLSLASTSGPSRPVLLTARAGADAVHGALIEATERTRFESDLVVARRTAEDSARALDALRTSAESFLASSTEEELLQALTQTFVQTFRPSEIAVLTPAGESRWHGVDGGVTEAWAPPTAPTVLPRPDAGTEAERVLAVALRRPERLAQAVLTPVSVEGETIAVIVCAFHREREPDEGAQRLRESIAQNAGVALTRIRLQGRLARSAREDPLTGLLNRGALHAQLETAAAFGRFGILFLDLDGFKSVNDVHGHVAGDEVLVRTAARLKGAVRDRDVVARWGGDEFVVVCFGVERSQLEAVASRVAAEVAAPAEHPVTASIGAVVVDAESHPSADTLLELADAAMYRSKQAGGARVTLVEAS
ncbi:GGDEF domain-containing protein [Herbiconiux sp. SYSU D00978]|uniref:GGDEF domain-containing protein n=1 Tax=Herbiconiux sp. SYSU D00978 TaxID=2812562 RepID=UPI001A963BB7|nr:sensor domain-containing diguanylate cyclase [Herbiconiux sp. SYSU D00978]